MARPRKCRRICIMPDNTDFGPRCQGQNTETILMTLDEYETIRLIDLEGLTQEDAAARMNVARTTIQSIYICARKKLANCLVKGNSLRIEGGDIELCDRQNSCPNKEQCTHRRCN